MFLKTGMGRGPGCPLCLPRCAQLRRFGGSSDVSLASGEEYVSLSLLTPSMWLPCGSLGLHRDESAGFMERRECVACREQGQRGVEEPELNEMLGQAKEGQEPTWLGTGCCVLGHGTLPRGCCRLCHLHGMVYTPGCLLAGVLSEPSQSSW